MGDGDRKPRKGQKVDSATALGELEVVGVEDDGRVALKPVDQESDDPTVWYSAENFADNFGEPDKDAPRDGDRALRDQIRG